MQGIGISMAGFQLAFQLAERSNRSLYTDWEMFLVGFEGIEEPPEALESADSQVGEAWTWEREGHEKQATGTAARLAAADKPTVVELSGDDLSVAQVRDAWRAGGAPRSAAEEEKVFEDLNRHRLLERYTPNKYVRENLAALGSHERVVHIRVGDGGGPEGEGPCHVEDSRINLSAGMAALQQASLFQHRATTGLLRAELRRGQGAVVPPGGPVRKDSPGSHGAGEGPAKRRLATTL